MGNQSYGWHSGHPGSTGIIESAERTVQWYGENGQGLHFYRGADIDSTAVDATNTVTTVLRPGLVMARLDATGQWVDYDPDAVDGSQEAQGILTEELNMMDPATSAVQDRSQRILVRGGAIASELIGLDYQARCQLVAKGIFFDDGHNPTLPWRRAVVKAANYTVLAADNGTLFTTKTGAVVFTLPTIAAGLSFFFLNSVDADMTISSAEGNNIIGLHNLTADGIAFSTSSKKIGGMVRITAIYVDTTIKWIVSAMSAGDDNTVTVVSA